VKLDWFMLADAAVVTDGKYYIHGGAITRITVGALPWVHPQLALVQRILLEPQDVGAHEVTIAVLNPRGEKITESKLGFSVQEPTDLLEGEPFSAHLALTLVHVVLAEEGPHQAIVAIDGEPWWREPFIVKYQPPRVQPES
jgi:hypothetical protein